MTRTLLRDLVPPTVLVRERGDVVHVHGRTGLFLEPAPGAQAAANIFNMVRDGLQVSLAAAMRQAASSGEEVVHRAVRVKTNGRSISVNVRVKRLEGPEPLRGLFRITFESTRPLPEPAGPGEGGGEGGPSTRFDELERELEHTKESHQATIEELETSNEELKSTNEELQSTNEELQSTNEELETSKEEMHSMNEELQTVNAELEGKLDELSRANSDMKNLLNGTDIATIFLDNELRIKRYTERARKVIRMIPTDVGRPVSDLVSTLHYDRLVDDAAEVLRTLVYKETEVRGQDDDQYLMRILPYRTTENVIDGLVLTFVDITRVRALEEEQQRLLEALRESPASVFGQDRELRFTWTSSPLFGKRPEDLIGKTEADVLDAESAGQLMRVKQRVLDSGTPERCRLSVRVGGEERTYDVFVGPKRNPSGEVIGLSCVAMDLTFPATTEGS